MPLSIAVAGNTQRYSLRRHHDFHMFGLNRLGGGCCGANVFFMVPTPRNRSGSNTAFHILKENGRGFTGGFPERPIIGTPHWRRRKFDPHTLGFARGWVEVDDRGDQAPLATGIVRFVRVDLRMNLVEDAVTVARVSEGFSVQRQQIPYRPHD